MLQRPILLLARLLASKRPQAANAGARARVWLAPPQVGTLDALMQLSDDLARADMVSEATVTKVVSALASLLDRNMEKLESNLTANGSTCMRNCAVDLGPASRPAHPGDPDPPPTSAPRAPPKSIVRHTPQARWTSTWSRSSGTRPSTRSRAASVS